MKKRKRTVSDEPQRHFLALLNYHHTHVRPAGGEGRPQRRWRSPDALPRCGRSQGSGERDDASFSRTILAPEHSSLHLFPTKPDATAPPCGRTELGGEPLLELDDLATQQRDLDEVGDAAEPRDPLAQPQDLLLHELFFVRLRGAASEWTGAGGLGTRASNRTALATTAPRTLRAETERKAASATNTRLTRAGTPKKTTSPTPIARVSGRGAGHGCAEERGSALAIRNRRTRDDDSKPARAVRPGNAGLKRGQGVNFAVARDRRFRFGVPRWEWTATATATTATD